VPHGIGRPIGIFDSGVGGFTVLRACIAALPGEDVVYFGDTAWFPYGERDPVEVRARALAIGGWLARQGVKLVAVACNTATAVALPDLQRALPQPVVGPIRPDVHAAVHATRNRHIGVLATAATIASGAYPRMIHAYDAGARVTGVACPGLAAAVQNGGPLGPSVVEMVARCAAPLREDGVDTAILGCTHFPAVAPLVADALPGVMLIEGGAEMAGEVVDALERRGIRRPAGRGPGRRRFACSGDPEAFRALGARLLAEPIDAVEVVDPGVHKP
jgi:glutamate racemase